MKTEVNLNRQSTQKEFSGDTASLAVAWGSRADVPEELRLRLYPAVFEAFAAADFNAVGMRDLSIISGLSTATIYKYFNSKESLLTTVCAEIFPHIATRMDRSIEQRDSSEKNCKALFMALLSFYDENPSLPIVFFVTVPSKLWMQTGGWKAFEVIPVFKRIIIAGKKSKEIDDSINISTLMGLFYMHIQREVHIWYMAGQKWKMSDRVDLFFPYFWKSIERAKLNQQ